MTKWHLCASGALILAFLNVSTVESQVTQVAVTNRIAAGPSLSDVTEWIKKKLPVSASDSVQEGYRSSVQFRIESAVISDCRLAVVTTGEAGDYRSRTTMTAMLKDVDISRLGPYSIASGRGTPFVQLHALVGRDASFTLERKMETAQRIWTERVGLIQFVLRDSVVARPVANALRRAAVLCGAPDPNFEPVASAVGRYISPDTDDYIELGSNGKFTATEQRGKKSYGGSYSVRHDTVTLKRSNDVTSTGYLAGNSYWFDVIDDLQVWQKQSRIDRPRTVAQAPVAEQPPQKPKPASSSSSGLTNEDVVRLVAASLSEQVIITSIRQATASNFDLTVSGLLGLKRAHVSDAVILAMQERHTASSGSMAVETKVPPRSDATSAPPSNPVATPAPPSNPVATPAPSGVAGSIVGKWVGSEERSTWQFFADGTLTVDAGEALWAGTYRFDEAGRLSMTLRGLHAPPTPIVTRVSISGRGLTFLDMPDGRPHLLVRIGN